MPYLIPFLLGAQYYRAPTPEAACRAGDRARMRALGCNAVKYWVQWRWSHRLNDRFDFTDLDRLMNLALENGMQVTLNVIFDISLHWLYEKYPDAKQILNNGRVVEPYVVGHRQIGGHPGPCYNHPGARAERQAFLRAVVEHFHPHPAPAMWDVWNEPELAFPQRSPAIETLACYCPNCQAGFKTWLKAKYTGLDYLNEVWGRCYETWEQIETPRSGQAFTDFIDWREFHIQTMTGEAAWRIAITRELNPGRVSYLHVVPNVLTAWNPVSCATDDFALAELCDVFAATMNGGPVLAQHVLSAGLGKICYNVESHLNFGSTAMHQRRLDLDDLLKDWLPQIGLGIRGLLFWQYRPEVLGLESPAWGLVALDGRDRPTCASQSFTEKITPHALALVDCHPPLAEVGVGPSHKNEIFHFAIQGEFGPLAAGLEAYIQALYWNSNPYRTISGDMLARGELNGLKLLILPVSYYLTEGEASSLDTWVRSGGVALCEAHLGGYNGTSGRHSRTLPGCGLAESWQLCEVDSTSTYHLKSGAFNAPAGSILPDDSTMPLNVRKALADFQHAGELYFPILLEGGGLAWGADRYAGLVGDGLVPVGSFEPGLPCLASTTIGNGAVFYAATHLGQGEAVDPAGVQAWLQQVLKRAGVGPTAGLRGSGLGYVRVDLLRDSSSPRYLVLHNRAAGEMTVQLDHLLDGHDVFSGQTFGFSDGKPFSLPSEWIDLIHLRYL